MRACTSRYTFLLLLGVLGCTPSADVSPVVRDLSEDPEPPAADQAQFENNDDRRFGLFADKFAAALVAKNYEAAWKLGSSHLRQRITAQQLASAEQESFQKFGQPTKALTAGSVTSDRDELRNPADVTDAIDRVSVARSVGDIPASVPVELRRASVQIDVLRDPKTIPDYKAEPADTDSSDDDEAPRSYLTVVLVEEKGKLGVAHFWHRWPDILD